MVLLEALVVTAVVGLLVYGTIRLLTRPGGQGPTATIPGRWRVTHHDKSGQTRVVLQKVSETGAQVLDEHVVAVIDVDDPAYDAKFLAAMSAARERRALFELEEDG